LNSFEQDWLMRTEDHREGIKANAKKVSRCGAV
jgi:hypothetical protein